MHRLWQSESIHFKTRSSVTCIGDTAGRDLKTELLILFSLLQKSLSFISFNKPSYVSYSFIITPNKV